MTSTAAAPDREPLAGLVERVTYHNPDNGYESIRNRGALGSLGRQRQVG